MGQPEHIRPLREDRLSYADQLDTLLKIARDAGALISRVYATDFKVDYKGPSDPVTEADRSANALICTRLHEAFGAIPVVAEESDPKTFGDWQSAERVFFVDPLDGTMEFVSRNDDFAVMIGLAEAGRAVAGVLFAPALGRAWAGAAGLGAWEIDTDGWKHPIEVSRVDRLAAACVVASRAHRSERLEHALQALAPARMVARGSAGLKGAEVATGRADLYVQLGPAGKRWDACAPEAIVRGAGGAYTDCQGAPFDYRAGGLDNLTGVVASNGRVHDQILARLASLEHAEPSR